MGGVAWPCRLRQRPAYRHEQFGNGFGTGTGSSCWLADALSCRCPRFDARRAGLGSGRRAERLPDRPRGFAET